MRPALPLQGLCIPSDSQFGVHSPCIAEHIAAGFVVCCQAETQTNLETQTVHEAVHGRCHVQTRASAALDGARKGAESGPGYGCRLRSCVMVGLGWTFRQRFTLTSSRGPDGLAQQTKLRLKSCLSTRY